MMTQEERLQERHWLVKNRNHPDFQKRVEIYNNEVKKIKAEKKTKERAKAKEFSVGEIVRVNHYKTEGFLFRVEKVKIQNIMLKELKTKRSYNVQASLIQKIETEDSELISSLDDIGLMEI